jgi:Flp pilus assembly protein TadG
MRRGHGLHHGAGRKGAIVRNGRVRRQRGDSGAAAVEFALVLPILLMLVFGIIQFGFILAQQVALNGAVRSGARYGSVNAYTGTHTCSSVVDNTRNAANTIGMGGSQVDVKISLNDAAVCGSDGTGDQADPPCTDPTGDVADPDTITLHASGSYQCEYN